MNDPGRDKPILVLAGPTAVGKTAIGIQIARASNGEIISADSRQIYRQLSIGSAKPSLEETAGVPHHFIDELNLEEPFSAGAFARQATERIRDIRQRGRRPIIVGGSTLYLQALLHGLADIPSVPEDIRRDLNEKIKEHGVRTLYRELVKVDPVLAATIPPTHTQRIVRALEVYLATGKSLSSFWKQGETHDSSYETYVLDLPRALLYESINFRTDRMIERGLIAEIEAILTQGYDPEINALQTIGYREGIQLLNDEITLEEATSAIKQATRRYAKRQLTWFRRFPEYKWLDVNTGIDDFIKLQTV